MSKDRKHESAMSAAPPDASRTTSPRNLIFAARAGDPRSRRAVDVVLLVGSLLVAVLAAWIHSARIGLDEELLALFADGVPSWLDTIAVIVFLVGGLYPLGLLLGILIFGRGRWPIARDMILAAVLAVAIGTLGALTAGPEWPDVLQEITGRDSVPSYPLLRLSASVAILTVAAPYLSLPMRRVGVRLVGVMMIAAILLGFADFSSIIGGLAVGTAAAAAIHLIFGSGVGIPSKARIIDALRTIQLEPAELDYADEQPIGATLARARLADGTEAMVKIYGRDASDAATLSRFWDWIRFRQVRRGRPLGASGLQQVEHEALMLLEARRAQLPVPKLLGWGVGESGDALIVTPWPGGDRLRDLKGSDVSDTILQQCWAGLTRFHDTGQGAKNAQIDGTDILVTDDQMLFLGLESAVVTPGEEQKASGTAQLLTTTAVAVGPERAIAVARAAIGDERLAAALPLLQSAVMSSVLQHDVEHSDFTLKELRHEVADAIGTEAPELIQLQRVTWANVATLALTVFAAYALISSLADIGFDTIVDQFRDAQWSWVVTALILAQLTNVGEFFSMTGAVSRTVRVPFGPTMMFRYALSYVSLAIPGEAGSMAMNIRYMQKLGVSTAKAVAQGPLLSVFSFALDIALFLIALQFVGSDVVDQSGISDLDVGPALKLLGLVLVLVVVGIVVTLAVPKLRNRIVPHVKEGLSTVKGAITDPERLLRIAGGTLLQKLFFALTLAAAVVAFGDSLSLAEAIFVNTAVSLFVGLIPVPGGIGVGEAALTAGLIAVGVPEGAAFGAALTHRMATSYLPPVFGWYASSWLTKRDYL